MSDSLWPHGLHSPWNSPGQNTGTGSLSLLQGIFLTEELNPGLPQCRWILYQLSHKGSPRILEWEAQEYWSGQPIPSPADLPDPGIESGSPALKVDSLPTELLETDLPESQTKQSELPASQWPLDQRQMGAASSVEKCLHLRFFQLNLWEQSPESSSPARPRVLAF